MEVDFTPNDTESPLNNEILISIMLKNATKFSKSIQRYYSISVYVTKNPKRTSHVTVLYKYDI